MKHILIGLFGGYLAGLTSFILVTPDPSSMNLAKEEYDNYMLGLYPGIILGFASLVWLLVSLF